MGEPTFEQAIQVGDFYVKEHDYILWKTYSIGVRRYYLNIVTHDEGTIVHVNQKKIFQSKKEQMEYKHGPIMPGLYTITAEKTFPYTKLHKKEEAIVLGEPSRNINASLSFEKSMVQIKTNFNDVQVFVNEKPLKQTFKDDDQFGPVTRDGKLKIYGRKTFPWGESQSEVTAISKDTSKIDISPTPYSDEVEKKKITELLHRYQAEVIDALYSKKVHNMVTVTDSFKINFQNESPFENPYVIYRGKAIETKVDFDHARFYEVEGQYKMELTVYFRNTLTPFLYYEKKFQTKERETIQNITLVYSEQKKKWLVEYVLDDAGGEYFLGNNVVSVPYGK
ncbi:hypothetical protein IC620_14885 [Hazenella sp. IB182357]|uniref:Uncharacterized protein n=1 Tax=Polycladospora coralii TaxID=2771432 RepID=A0A926ND56_9BACL|nr:hypothetical protein [Polycladospora coralii]MBD1373630.1 hypothetical protein [Polycladospora coralii]